MIQREVIGNDKNMQVDSGLEPVTHVITQNLCWQLHRLIIDNELVIIQDAFAYCLTTMYDVIAHYDGELSP